MDIVASRSGVGHAALIAQSGTSRCYLQATVVIKPGGAAGSFAAELAHDVGVQRGDLPLHPVEEGGQPPPEDVVHRLACQHGAQVVHARERWPAPTQMIAAAQL